MIGNEAQSLFCWSSFVKMAHDTLKEFLKLLRNDLIMKNLMLCKTYILWKKEENAILDKKKKFDFQQEIFQERWTKDFGEF